MNDKELKSLIRKGMRHDRGNVFFVRKVLNRLPEKETPQPGKWIIRGARLASTAILTAYWLEFLLSRQSTGHQWWYFFLLWCATLFTLCSWLRQATAG